MLPEENYSCYGLVDLKVEVSWGGAEAIKDAINLSRDHAFPTLSNQIQCYLCTVYLSSSSKQNHTSNQATNKQNKVSL